VEYAIPFKRNWLRVAEAALVIRFEERVDLLNPLAINVHDDEMRIVYYFRIF
jgi:hypothetical protein